MTGSTSPAIVAGRGYHFVRVLAIAGGIAVAIVFLIFVGLLPPVVGTAAVAAVLAALFWLIRDSLSSVLLVFVTVLLASILFLQRPPKLRPDRVEAQDGERLSKQWAASAKFNEQLPIVIHLIFDEMMSTGAMTSGLPGGDEARRSLLEFGENHSFRTFDSVYSRYYHTSEAIPNLVNREYLGRTGMDSFFALPLDPATKAYSVRNNAYFDDMARRGYRTAVFQSNYIDFCANRNVDLCETLDSFDPGLENIAAIDTPTQRVRTWQTVLRAYEPSYTSEIGHRILGRVYGLDKREVKVVGAGGRYDVHRFPEWFDRFTAFAANVPRGTHVFAHFLVPHSPYLLLESCVVSGQLSSGLDLSRFPPAERAKRRHDSYERFLVQTRCVANKLDGFMTALGESERFRDAVIIIHGDHGSRISISKYVEDLGPRELVDNYATYFAVRAPGVPAGVDCELASLPQLFRRYVAPDRAAAPGSGPPLPLVAISRDGGGNRRVEVRMPPFGCARQ